jgi:uncharacterized iron-regulated protein
MNVFFKGCVFFLLGSLALTPLSVFANGDADAGDLWINVYQGEQIGYADMLADLAKADVIYLGERHTIVRHHKIQEQILADLGKQAIPLAVGLEQMEADKQPQLDRFNRGEIDFAELAKATDWAKRWANYDQYRGALETAQKLKAPVVALNAKAETIRQVARSGGVEKMPAELRKELPDEMQLQDPAYEKALSLELMVHAAAMPNMLRPMIEAQMARDESMAAAVAAFLKSDEGKGRKMIVLCGGGHVAHGLGAPARVRRRLPDIKDRIVLLSESGELKLSPAEQAMASNVEVTHEQLRQLTQPIADYLFIKPRAEKKAESLPENPQIPVEIERAMLGEGYLSPSLRLWDGRNRYEEKQFDETEFRRMLQFFQNREYDMGPHPERMPDVDPPLREYPLEPRSQ